MADGTNCTDPFSCIVAGVGNTVGGVANTISYWSDPWGNTYKALRDAANGLATELLPQLTSATLPDLTVDWFVNAYRISFAVGIFAAVVLLIPQILRTARGIQSGRDLMESIGLYFPVFLVGAMFGPAIGVLLVNFFKALSDSFASWGLTSTVDEVNSRFTAMLSEDDPAGIAGGVPVAVLLMFLMLVGLFFVLLILVVQLVTLYFTGVLIPLALVWVIDPTRRSFGLRLVGVWVGILAAHPLLFFLLGFAFTMLGGSVNFLGNDASLQKLVQLLAAVIAMFIAACSPLLLLKFAPVIPVGFGGTRGPGIQPGSWGPDNMSDALARYRSTSNGPSGSAPAASAAAEPESPVMSGSGGSGLSAAASRAAGTAAGDGAAAAGSGAAAAGGGLAAAGAAESATGVGAAIGVPTLIAAGAMTAGSAAMSVAQAASDHAVAAMDQEEQA